MSSKMSVLRTTIFRLRLSITGAVKLIRAPPHNEDMHFSAVGRIITGTTPRPCLIVEEGGVGWRRLGTK